jgi:molybdate transport system substrate-binding protein
VTRGGVRAFVLVPFLATFLVGFLVAACGRSTAGERATVTVFAAASLRDAVERSVSAYRVERPDVRFVLSTESSAALRTQIEQGAPADLFLSADTANPERLVSAGLAGGPPIAFAGAPVAIVVPSDNPAAIRSPADLARAGVRIIAAGPEVPITAYAERLVTRLASIEGYPAEFAAGYGSNVRSLEDNVRAVLAKIALGEGDAAIVYEPDARASGAVALVPLPAGAAVTARYAGVVVRDSPVADEAAAFLAWLAGVDGAAVLAELGFTAP